VKFSATAQEALNLISAEIEKLKLANQLITAANSEQHILTDEISESLNSDNANTSRLRTDNDLPLKTIKHSKHLLMNYRRWLNNTVQAILSTRKTQHEDEYSRHRQ